MYFDELYQGITILMISADNGIQATTLFKNVSDFLQNQTEDVEFSQEVVAAKLKDGHSTRVSEMERTPSIIAIWLYLLRRLLFVSVDKRLEVRHSKLPPHTIYPSVVVNALIDSLRTMFKILEDGEDRLGPEVWYICFQDVLLETLFFNESGYKASGKDQSADQRDEQIKWNESAIIIIRELSELLVRYIEHLRAYHSFVLLWEKLVEGYACMLQRQNLEISTAMYSALSAILIEMGDNPKIPQPMLEKTWDLWQNNSPIFHMDNRGQADNHKAVLAYFGCLHQIIYLLKANIDITKAKTVLQIVCSGILNSSNPPYSSDIDSLSPVQVEAINILKIIPKDVPGVVPEMLNTIANLVTMAYEPRQISDKVKPTFVALSKAAMDMMRLYVELNITQPDIQYQGALTRAIIALTVPLNLKYKWQKEGNNPQTWQKATSTALDILGISIPVLQCLRNTPDDLDSFWEVTAKIGKGIMAADCSERRDLSNLQNDQVFDINAFNRFQDLVIPVLGASCVRDAVRYKYAASIFKYSLIHDPHPDDLPKDDQEPLAALRSTHIGRTNDLPPTIRSQMTYVLLDELFNLVAVHDRSAERIKLAQAAMPYLLLRAGVTLKAYVMDQPLRGRMPQPRSQKREMLYILHKLVELECEPKAMADMLRIDSDRKKHLRYLYPLVMKALETAWRDETVIQALRGVLNAIGEAWEYR